MLTVRADRVWSGLQNPTNYTLYPQTSQSRRIFLAVQGNRPSFSSGCPRLWCYFLTWRRSLRVPKNPRASLSSNATCFFSLM